METHGLPGGEPRQFEVNNPHPANPPTPVDKCSTLIAALHNFAPDTFKVHFSEQSCVRSTDQSRTRSIEIGSVEVWERFVATLQPETTTQQNTEAQALYNFVEHQLR
jgi:hypothetical protein